MVAGAMLLAPLVIVGCNYITPDNGNRTSLRVDSLAVNFTKDVVINATLLSDRGDVSIWAGGSVTLGEKAELEAFRGCVSVSASGGVEAAWYARVHGQRVRLETAGRALLNGRLAAEKALEVAADAEVTFAGADVTAQDITVQAGAALLQGRFAAKKTLEVTAGAKVTFAGADVTAQHITIQAVSAKFRAENVTGDLLPDATAGRLSEPFIKRRLAALDEGIDMLIDCRLEVAKGEVIVRKRKISGSHLIAINASLDASGTDFFRWTNITLSNPTTFAASGGRVCRIDGALATWMKTMPLWDPIRTLTLSGVKHDGLFGDILQTDLLPWLEHFQSSGTNLTGMFPSKMPPFLDTLVVVGESVTGFENAAWYMDLNLADLRYTTFMNKTAPQIAHLAFRHGVPSCPDEGPSGTDPKGQLCRVCVAGYYQCSKSTDKEPCKPCESGDKVLKRLFIVVSTLLAGGLAVAVLGTQRLKTGLVFAVQGTAFVGVKVTHLVSAYQKVHEVAVAGGLLPAFASSVSDHAWVFSLDWLHNTAFVSCVLRRDYHWSYSLLLVEVLIVLAVVIWLNSWHQENLRLKRVWAVYSFTYMLVAARSVALFRCDQRLQRLQRGVLELPENVKQAFLMVDYQIGCDDTRHRVFMVTGAVVLALYCTVPLLLLARALWKRRAALCPQGGSCGAALLSCARDLGGLELPPCGWESSWTIWLQGQLLRESGTAVKGLAALTDKYVPTKIWYCLVPLAGRLGIAVALLPSDSTTRAILGHLWCVSLAVLVCLVRPYRRRSDGYMEAASLFAVALVFAAPLATPQNKTFNILFRGVALLAVLTPALMLFFYTCRGLCPTRYREAVRAEEAALQYLKQGGLTEESSRGSELFDHASRAQRRETF